MTSDFNLNDDMDEDAAANDVEMFQYDLNFVYDDGIDSENNHDNIGFDLNQTPSPDATDATDATDASEPASNHIETAANNSNQQATSDHQDTASNINNQQTPINPENSEAHHQPTRRRLSSGAKLDILIWLLTRSTNGNLKYGSIQQAANHFNLCSRTILRIWKKGKEQRDAQLQYNMSTGFHNCGRKRITIPNDAIRAVAMGNRSCQRDLAVMLNVGKSTIQRLIERGEVRPHTNALKPKLTPANRLDRLRFILNSIVEAFKQKDSCYNNVNNT